MSERAGELTGRRIAVIGVSPGQIGGSIVDRLAAEGASLVIGGRSQMNLTSVAERVPHAVRDVVAVDIADEASVREFFGAAVAALGGLDGVVNNAAIYGAPGADSDALSIAMDDFDQLLSVNLRGQLLSVRGALPHLLEAGGGSIVLTSSIAGVLGEPTRVSYGVAKAGVLALVRHVAARWGKQGIRCNAVVPGRIVRDEQLPESEQPFHDELLRLAASPRLGRPADIAAAVRFLLSEDSAFINGVPLMVDGGTSAVFAPASEDDGDFYPRYPFSRGALGLGPAG